MFGDGHLGTMAGAQDACGKAEWIVEGLKAVMEEFVFFALSIGELLEGFFFF